ncbi:MAG: DUF1080 domain-containing protein [bacterium]|nr:DUF1080 domain-containing protein [bacterium]
MQTVGFKVLAAVLYCTLSPGLATAAMSFEDSYPKKPDPFVGDYVGRWGAQETINPDVAAQVIALGRDKYRIRVVSKLDMRCPVLVETEVEPKRGKLRFDTGGYHGVTDGKTFTGGRGRRLTFTMARVERKSPTLGTAPPEGAVVLFDGSGVEAWDGAEDCVVGEDGTLMVTPDAGYLESKGKWRDIRLHVEFRLPFVPRARGQQRGNSGVFVQDVYEVQILDSYGLEGYYNECGALYKLSAPHVNACRAPLVWQTYDITYRAPRFDGAGKLVENGRMTVLHNGVPIHTDQELKWLTNYKETGRQKPPPSDPGRVRLQGHGNYLQFRNIWLVDLSKGE